jgi:ribosomal protein S18 acetylase RimI-like enzyme
LILEALDRFRQIGPRRVHVLTHTSGWEVLNSCPALRFAQPPGEKLLECSVEKFFARKFRLTGYEVRALAAQDIAAVTNSLSDMPEVAFERWEPHLAQHNIGNANCAQFVAFSGDELIGVVLGGVLGSRATITHTWVKEGCRTRGLGHHLAYAAVTSMEHQGAKDLHLMLAAGNEKVQPFWESMGFKEKAGHIFLECDL